MRLPETCVNTIGRAPAGRRPVPSVLAEIGTLTGGIDTQSPYRGPCPSNDNPALPAGLTIARTSHGGSPASPSVGERRDGDHRIAFVRPRATIFDGRQARHDTRPSENLGSRYRGRP